MSTVIFIVFNKHSGLVAACGGYAELHEVPSEIALAELSRQEQSAPKEARLPYEVCATTGMLIATGNYREKHPPLDWQLTR